MKKKGVFFLIEIVQSVLVWRWFCLLIYIFKIQNRKFLFKSSSSLDLNDDAVASHEYLLLHSFCLLSLFSSQTISLTGKRWLCWNNIMSEPKCYFARSMQNLFKQNEILRSIQYVNLDLLTVMPEGLQRK